MDISIYKLKTKFQNLLMPICEKLVIFDNTYISFFKNGVECLRWYDSQ